MSSNLPCSLKYNIDTLGREDLARICDCSFLSRPESFVHLADKNHSAMYLYNQAFYNFMSETITSTLYPFGIRVHPENVFRTQKYLDESKIEDMNVIAVVGFPYGDLSTPDKMRSLMSAIDAGADEAEIVMNYNYG